jgi:hypothetical protein
MKLSQLAAATLVPATIAGIALTAMPFAEASPAATAHHAARHAAKHVAAASATKAAKTAEASKPRTTAHAAAQPATTHPASAQHPATTTQAPKQAAAQAPAQPSTPTAPQTQTATANQPITAGMSSFEQCVAWRESGDNPTASSAGLFGILPATWQQLGYSGTAGQASVALQKVAFQRLYAQLGTSPWAPYDGC